MGTQMDRLVDEHFKELRKRSSLSALDENSKKVEKRKSLDCNLLKGNKAMAAFTENGSWDLKSVKVLVERTKFNEMQVVDAGRNTLSPVKIPNGTLHKTPQKRRRGDKKKPSLAVASQRPCIDELFRIRRCYVKVSKDKQLTKLLHTVHNVSVTNGQKRTRGRPKKQKKGDNAGDDSSTSDDVDHQSLTSNNLKRKNNDPTESTLSKRIRRNKSEAKEFFINIDALLCGTPRRRSIKSNISEESKRRSKKGGIPRGLKNLRQKFGTRFFMSYVKVKRQRELNGLVLHDEPAQDEVKKKKKGKNLSVSFLETVEIFGESSEGEEWPDYEEPSFSGKATRVKRLDDGALFDEEIGKSSMHSSTPYATRLTSESSVDSANSPHKRREKISFSPLKEADSSPRKDELKLANEKIVRRSFEEQPAEEEEPDTVSSRQNTTENKLTSPKDSARDRKEDKAKEEGDIETQEEPIAVKTSQDSEVVDLETELITPPPSEEKIDEHHKVIDDDDEVQSETKTDEREKVEKHDEEEKKIEDNLENKTNLENETNLTNNKNDEISTALSENDKECVDSLEADVEALIQEEEINAQKQNSANGEDLGTLSYDVNEEKTPQDANTDVESIEKPSKESPNSSSTQDDESRTRGELSENKNNEAEDVISETTTNQVNISHSSDEQFEDASELIATVPLSERLVSNETEVDSVLGDVCHLAVDENGTLLSEENDEEEYGSPNNVPTVIADDEDDFTSVLTHPEVERSLQSAASSTLVPNSQEIVVAAAVTSQATLVPPPDVDVTEDTFASVVAEVERFTKDVNPEIYSENVGITGTDVMMDNVQARNSLDDIFDDDVDDDIISSLRMSSSSIDICHDKNLPIQVIETEVMAIPNEPDIIFDKPLGTTASILGTSMNSTNDTLNTGCGHSSTAETSSKLSLGRLFQSVKSYVMSPKDKHTALKD